jgi:diacylglycerol O-acyltransferase / wax synthase
MTARVVRDTGRKSRDTVESMPRRPSTSLSAADTLLWNIEKDPSLRTTIVAISVLDRCPDWERLTERITDAGELVPRLRQRIESTSLGFGPLRLGSARWRLDEGFDLSYHLRRVVAPAPGDLRTLLDIVGTIAMSVFDKDRPLWEFTLVEGLSEGRAALIQKIHHSFTDGVGGVQLAQLLFDDKREPPRRRPKVHTLNVRPGDALTSVAEALASDVRAAAVVSTRVAESLPGLAARAVTNPVGLLATTARNAQSVGKLLAPVTKPLSPIMNHRGLGRRLDIFDIPLESLLKAGHAADSSLNDAFLAGIAGGMRRYHERHGQPVGALRVTMPINRRRAGDPTGGNRFTPARFTLPVATEDAAERMRQLGALSTGWRHEPALPLTDVIAGVLNRLPVVATTQIFGSMLKAIDFVATNVPGLKHRAYLAGAEVTRQYAFAPPSGAAFSVALLSHVDQCCFGVNVDTSAVPDPDVLATCLLEGFDEVLAVRKRE